MEKSNVEEGIEPKNYNKVERKIYFFDFRIKYGFSHHVVSACKVPLTKSFILEE